MDYTNYSIEDFVKDENFKHWVLHPDSESNFFWGSFLQNYPDQKNNIGIARSVLLSVIFPEPDVSPLSEEEKDFLFEKINTTKRIEGNLKKHPDATQKWLNINQTIRAAVILLLCTVMAVVWNELSWEEPDSEIQFPVDMITKSTPFGQKLSIHLNDGSEVKLNGGSYITYPENFIDQREIILTGEAFFDVAELPGKPFTIKTGDITTTVVGTAFNIKYIDDSMVDIAVLRGKVTIDTNEQRSKKQDPVVINPTEMMSYNPVKGSFTKKSLEYNQVFGWTHDIIYFKNNNIDEIFSTLEKWYGVHFNVKIDLSKKKDFSGIYENKNLDAVLTGIGFAFGFDFDINGKEVIIK